MNEKELNELALLWKEAKVKNSTSTDVGAIIKAGEVRKKNTLAAHYGNAAVLSATVAMLVFFFYYLYNFQDVLSKIGYNLMIGGLVVRILIELFSVWRSRKIKFYDSAADSLQNSIDFHEFRKRIHGPVTMVIFVLYFIGFYLLTPELYRHISILWLALIDVSALLIATVLVYFIRKGIRQELHDLEKMVDLHRNLVKMH